MATIDDIAALLKSAGLDPRQANGVLEAFRIALTGGISLTVKESGTTVSSSVTALDFGAGFDVTESPAGEANVALDMTEAPYDNATSGLAATNVQAAIDELVAIGGGSVPDGDKGDITVSGSGTVWNLDLNLSTIDAPTASVNFAQQQATQFRIENRTSDPGAPADGEIWLRTDL